MAIQVLPPRQTGLGNLAGAMSPYLQAAFQEKLKQKSQMRDLERLKLLFGGGGFPTQGGATPPPVSTQQSTGTPPQNVSQSFNKQYGAGMPLTQLGITGGKVGGLTVGQTPESKAAQDVYKTGAQEDVRRKTKVATSKMTSQYNLDLVAGNFRDYAEILSDAYKEGGAGDIYKSMFSTAIEKGYAPAGTKISSQFPRTSALVGKHFELVAKMFPMLTQQIGKEGSVRLIESIFSKLGATLPTKPTPEANAPEMMKTSFQSMYRVRRAFETINIENYDLGSKTGLGNFAKDMALKASQIEISGLEKEVLDSYNSKILEPFTKKSGQQGIPQVGQTFNNEKVINVQRIE